jgi:hypothetical protein
MVHLKVQWFIHTMKRYAVFKRAEVKNENDDATGNN